MQCQLNGLLATSFVILIVLFGGITRAQFYIGEYKTIQQHQNADKPKFSGVDVESNEISKKEESRSLMDYSRPKDRQAFGFFSPFNPLTPGGTIYLAFIFLIPLTVGKAIGRRNHPAGRIHGWITRILTAAQQDPSLYNNEMGFIDGNRAIKKAWKQFRRKMSWARRRRNRKKNK